MNAQDPYDSVHPTQPVGEAFFIIRHRYFFGC